MILLQINFDFPTALMGDPLFQNAKKLAESINEEPGFISKIWIENETTGRSGGIYLFDTLQNAQNYADMHSIRVVEMGASKIDCQYFKVNEALSEINNM